MSKLHCLFFAVVWLFVPVHSGSAAQEGAGGSEARLKAAVEEALDASRQLATTLMPVPAELGQGWKYPWELPEQVRRKAPSEDAYWQLANAELPAIGLDEEQAAAFVELFANAMAQAGAAEGLTPRDALMILLQKVRQHNVPFSQQVLEGLGLAATAYRERAQMGESAQNAPGSERQLVQMLLRPYGDLDDAALKRMAARELSLVKRRIPMTYFKSNDWQGLIESKLRDKEMAEKGLWLAVVEIQLMLLNPNPLTWPPDLTAENAGKMQQRALALFRELLLAETQRRRKELIAEAAQRTTEIDERLQSETDEERRSGLLAERRRIEEAFETEQAGLAEAATRVTQGLDLRIYMRDFGEHCHVFRLSGVSPDDVGIEASAYSAWLRNGRAVARITVGGNLDEATMTKIMDQVLSEMDARTAAYAGL